MRAFGAEKAITPLGAARPVAMIRSAYSVQRAPLSITVKVLRGIVSASREGFIGEGGSGAGAYRRLSASPMPLSLIRFLRGSKK